MKNSEKFQGNSVFQGKREVAQKSWMINNISIQWKISGETLFSGQAQVVKYPECKKYIQYSEQFQANSVFWGQAQKSWTVKKILNTVYIHLRVICVIWASAVCNLDRSRDRL